MITKETVKAFRTDFQSVVASLEKKYNVKIELGSISYTDTNFRTRMTCTAVNESGQKAIDETQFRLYSQLYGLTASIGDSYVSAGKTFTVTNLDPKKSKYPVLLTCSDGKTYKSSVEAVNFNMKYAQGLTK